MGFNDVFFLFRLPCFFFISGWLFQPSEGRPFWPVTRHKLMVQIVPTVIFLLLLAPPPLFFSRLGATKGGYWFTFAPFEFFVLYLLSACLGRRWSALLAVVISVAAYSYDACYHLLQPAAGPTRWVTDVLGLLSFMTWRYYLFFYIGTWVRRHFDDFVRWTSRWWVVASVAAGFFAISLTQNPAEPWLEFLRFS
jgi:fucose 4-O-acetylase-like acetyltransferase